MHMRRIVSYLGLQDCLISVARSQLGISERELVARSAPFPFIVLITELQVTDYSHKLKKALGSVLLKQEAVARSVPLPFHTVNNGITGYRLLAQTKEST